MTKEQQDQLLASARYFDYAANFADNEYDGMDDDEVIEIRVTVKALKDVHHVVESLIPVSMAARAGK